MSTSPRDLPAPSGRGGRLALAGVSVAASVMAALWMAHTVGAPGAMSNAAPARYEITARQDDHDPGAATGRLWLYRLLADGEIEPLDVLAREPAWRAETLAAGAPAGAGLTRESRSGTLWFRAGSFLLVTRSEGWSGSLTVRRDGITVREAVVRSSDSILVVDSSPPGGIAFRVGLALLLVGGLTAWARPWQGGRRAHRWLAGVLGTVHLCFWLAVAVGTTNDTPEYVLQIDTLRAGVPGYFPPGYPGFLGVMRWAFGPGYPLWVTLLQHAMVVVAALWLHRLLRRLVGEALAMCGALLAGGLAASLALPQAIMSGGPALFATVGAVWFIVRVRDEGRMAHAITAGLLIGWAGLLRVIPALAIAPVAFLLLRAVPGGRIRHLVAMLATAAAVIAAPIGWFALRSGTPALASSSALHLFNRVVTEQQLLDRSGPATRELLASLDGEDPRGLAWWDVWSRPRATHLEDAELQQAMGGAAKEGIRSAPVAFALYTPRLAWRELFAEASDFLPDWPEAQNRLSGLEVPPPLAPTAVGLQWRWAMEQATRRAWPVLAALALLGALVGMLRGERLLVAAMAIVPLLHLLGSATLEAFDSRYNFPVSALLVGLAMVFLDRLARLPRAVRDGKALTIATTLRQGGSATLDRVGRLAPGSTASAARTTIDPPRHPDVPGDHAA